MTLLTIIITVQLRSKARGSLSRKLGYGALIDVRSQRVGQAQMSEFSQTKFNRRVHRKKTRFNTWS